MNIDELISKYLDGELSEQEDALLRSKMSEDPLKKADFDDAIFMHHALKDDAKSIKLPEDLARDTQDLVLMKIFNEQPTILKLQKRRRVINRLSGAVAAVLVLGFAFISEFPNVKYLNTLYTYQAKELQNAKQIILSVDNNLQYAEAKLPKTQKAVAVIKNGISNSNSTMLAAKDAFKLLAPKADADATVIAMDNNNDSESANTNISNPASISVDKNSNTDISLFAKNEEIVEKSTINNTIENNSNRFSLSNSESNDINLKSQIQPARAINLMGGGEAIINQFIDRQQLNPGVELTTCYGSSIVNNVFNDGESKYSTGLSQSLGYRINDVHKFGFEFGYMNYSVYEMNMVAVPINTLGNGYSVEIQKDNGVPGPTILVPIKSTTESRSIWGTVFYEYRAIDLDWFSLDTRIGIGGSKDGLMNLGRIMGSIEVINGFSLVAGFDGRLFYTTIPKTNSGEAKLRGAMSLIYGIQLNF